MQWIDQWSRIYQLLDNHVIFFLVQPQEDGDIYLAGMLAIKLYLNLLEDPEMSFCNLYSHLENHQGGLISDEILTLVTL